MVRAVQGRGHCLGVSVNQTLKWSLCGLMNYHHLFSKEYQRWMLLSVLTEEGGDGRRRQVYSGVRAGLS